MRVALAHDHLNQVGGAERVLAEFHQLYPEAPIFTLLYDRAAVGNYFDNWKIKTSFIARLPGGSKFFKWYLALMPLAIEQFDLHNYDLVITSASALIKGVLVQPAALNICYCHTPTRYLWSDAHSYTSDLPQPTWVKKILPVFLSYLRQWDYLAAQRVDYYVANSHFVADRIAKYYRRESQVIYPPVNTKLWGEPVPPEKYFLIVARLRPYKKVDLAIKAFNKLNIPLKVIGYGEQAAELKAMAKSNIEFLGNLDDETKAYYMAHAQALIYPQEEDFGITAVESMACGRPVIAYAAGGATETVIDGLSGKLFKEQTWEALADTIIRFKQENYDPLKIKQHAQKFSRERFVTEWQQFINGLNK